MRSTNNHRTTWSPKSGIAFLDQLPLRRANRPVQFSPNREPEPFERGLACRPDQQWPNAPRATGVGHPDVTAAKRRRPSNRAPFSNLW